MVLRIFNLISDLNVSLLSYERFLVHELVLLLCDVNLAFLNEIAMQFIFLFLELVLAKHFVKSTHLKVMVLIYNYREIYKTETFKTLTIFHVSTIFK